MGVEDLSTMSVAEFAEAVGIGATKAREICAGEHRPPGIAVGDTYRVIRRHLAAWQDEASEKRWKL